MIAAVLATLTLAGVVTVWEIYVLALAAGHRSTPSTGRRGTRSCSRWSGPRISPNAVALSSSLGTLARILGPAIGGVVVAFAGAGVCFAVNSASFLGRSSLPARARHVEHAQADPRPRRDGRRRRARRAPLRRALAARRRRVLRRARARDVRFNFNVLLPLVADRTLHSGAQTFGLIAAVFGAGALCGALINAMRGQASLRRLLIGAVGLRRLRARARAAALARRPSACCLFVIGCFYTLWGTNALSAIQLEAPEHLRGRAASLYFFAFLGGAPLGGLFAGWLVSVGGTRARVLRRGVDRRADRARLRLDARRGLAAPHDVVVADQPVSDEADAPPSSSIASTPRCREPLERARAEVGVDDVRLRLGGADQRARARARARDRRRGGRAASSATSPAAARMPALCIVAPPRRFRCTRAAAIVSASPARIVAERRAEALVEAERDRVDRRRELRERDAERDRGVRRAARRRGATAAPALRARPSAPASARCRRAACACSRGRSRAAGSSSPTGSRPRDLASSQSPSFTRMCAVAIDRDAVARLA